MKRMLGFVGLAIVWELVSLTLKSPMFPDILQILLAFQSISLWEHIRSSLTTVSLGFLVAAVSGMLLGIAMDNFKIVYLVFQPIVDAIRPVAALTIFPLIILILGIGLPSKVFVIFWTAWPAVLLNTLHGLRTVDQSVIEAGQLDGAGQFQLLRHIKFPLALPMIMTGLQIALSGGWISLVAAEMLGSNSGLGYMTLVYSQTFRFPELYVVILLIASCGLAMNLILSVAKTFIVSIITGENINEKLTFIKNFRSPFVRYHNRAGSWNLDNLFTES